MATCITKIVRATRNQNVLPVTYAIQSRDHSSQVRIIKNPTTASLKRGSGGRSSFNGIVCTVFGCSGFIASGLCIRLARSGTQLILPYRCDPYHIRERKVGGDLGQVYYHPFHLKDEESIIRCMKYSNVVINLVGANYETSNFSFNEVNVEGARRLARLAKECNVERFIHVSCLNASQNPTPLILKTGSRLLKSKWEGEVAVKEEFPEATIVRPSLVYGRQDKFISHYMTEKRWIYSDKLPLWELGLKTEKQPVFFQDVISGIVAIVKNPDTAGKTYQFVGPKRYTLNKLVSWMIDLSMKHYGDSKVKIINMKYHPYFWLKTTVWDYLYIFHPSTEMLWEVHELHHTTDVIDENLPTLKDLGVALTPMESRIEWEILPYEHCKSIVDEFERSPLPNVQSVPK